MRSDREVGERNSGTGTIALPWHRHPQEAAAEIIERWGAIDGVLAPLGGWDLGNSLVNGSLEEFDAYYESHLRSHYAAVLLSTHLTTVSNRVTHVSFHGLASVAPIARSPIISVFGHAQRALGANFRSESALVGSGPLLREVVVPEAVVDDGRNGKSTGITLSTIQSVVTVILIDPTRCPDVSYV
ncbi:hypothetical protein [Brevibacterium litoralis]|uniref:hypothetical protein n=1 Tax=Brevibacterium litoralis TaxID=3138935 RepID=UPI0032ED8151